MKKKLLISQNASLFAELERKTGEIKTLEIKLEDLNTEYNNAKATFIQLEKSIENLEEENAVLKETIEQLENQIQQMVPINSSIAENAPLSKEEINNTSPQKIAKTVTDEQTATVQELVAPQHLSNKTVAENQISEAKPTPISKEELKSLGIKAIGEVTKAAALAMASVGEDEASYGKKSLIMGKNESFKFEILSILEKAAPDSDCQDKIEFLTKEALNHINNIV